MKEVQLSKGLVNIGNTCYMNSALQCILHIPQVHFYFLSPVNENDSNLQKELPNKEILREFSSFIKKYHNKRIAEPLNPRSLKNAISRRNSIFEGNNQQDSSELLVFLLDALHESTNISNLPVADVESLLTDDKFVTSYSLKIDLNFDSDTYVLRKLIKQCSDKKPNDACFEIESYIVMLKGMIINDQFLPKTKNPLINQLKETRENVLLFNTGKALTTDVKEIGIDDRTLSRLFNAFYTSKHFSFIYQNFYFQLKSEIVCGNCGYRSVTFDPASILFLNIQNKKTRISYKLINEVVKRVVYVIFEPELNLDAIAVEIEIKETENAANLIPRLKNKALVEQRNLQYILENMQGMLCLVNNGRLISILSDWDYPYSTIDNGNFYLYLFEELAEESNRFIPFYFKLEYRPGSLTEVTEFGVGGESELVIYKFPFLLKLPKENFLRALIERVFILLQSMGHKITAKGTDKLFERIVKGNLSDVDISFWDFSNSVNKATNTKSLSAKSRAFHYFNKNGSLEPFLFSEKEIQYIKEEEDLTNSDLSIVISSAENGFAKVLDNFTVKEKVLSAKSTFENSSHSDDRSNLYSLITNFSEPVKLDNYNSYYCEKCRNQHNNSKKFEIWNPPNVLIVCLKRFGFANRGMKISSFVDFPVDTLDLTNYVQQTKVLTGRDKQVHYELSSVCCHHGNNLNYGHYTAYAKVEGVWTHFNDSSVNQTTSINKNDAFILFYTRK